MARDFFEQQEAEKVGKVWEKWGGGAKLLVTDLFAVLIGYHSTNWFVVVVDE